jgi:hypothetical protein
MSSPGPDHRDFFISFNSADRAWAEWIAFELEAAGFKTFFQDWDFLPASNFVLQMHIATASAHRTIAVLSPDYLKALFTQPEWAAALVQDPTGSNRTLLPVRVQPCTTEGILKAIVYTDLVSLDEDAARKKLLSAVSGGRPKPDSVPFPEKGKRQHFPPSVKPSSATQRTVPLPMVTSVLPKPIHLNSWLPFVWFALALVSVVALIANAEKLDAFGLVNRLYYLALVVLGLAAAGSLLAVLRSQAGYPGKDPWGTLELGGPAGILFLVVLFGGWFAPRGGTFPLTVFVHGPNGPQDLLLRSQGKVAIDLNGDRRVEAIGEKGAAHFLIPPEFKGKEVLFYLEADGYERSDRGLRTLTGENLYMLVRKRAGMLMGIVLDQKRDPITGATVDVGGITAITNALGRFELSIPSDRIKDEMTLDVRAPGFEPQTHTVVPGSNEIRIALRPRPEK